MKKLFVVIIFIIPKILEKFQHIILNMKDLAQVFKVNHQFD